MNRSLRIKITIVCVIILGSIYFLYPTFKLWTMPAEERELMAIFDEKKWGDLSNLLISHGRAICEARKPKCEACAISKICPSAFKC